MLSSDSSASHLSWSPEQVTNAVLGRIICPHGSEQSFPTPTHTTTSGKTTTRITETQQGKDARTSNKF